MNTMEFWDLVERMGTIENATALMAAERSPDAQALNRAEEAEIRVEDEQEEAQDPAQRNNGANQNRGNLNRAEDPQTNQNRKNEDPKPNTSSGPARGGATRRHKTKHRKHKTKKMRKTKRRTT